MNEKVEHLKISSNKFAKICFHFGTQAFEQDPGAEKAQTSPQAVGVTRPLVPVCRVDGNNNGSAGVPGTYGVSGIWGPLSLRHPSRIARMSLRVGWSGALFSRLLYTQFCLPGAFFSF